MRRALSYGRISTPGLAAMALAAMSAAFAVSIASAEIGMAAEMVEIKMLNKGAGHYMAFEPELVRIKPGDTIKFVMTDKGHNAVSIQGMIPEAPALQKQDQRGNRGDADGSRRLWLSLRPASSPWAWSASSLSESRRTSRRRRP